MQYKDYFKQRLFENIMAMNPDLQIGDGGTYVPSISPNDMYTPTDTYIPSDMYAQVSPGTPSPSYPTYTVPAPTRDQYASDESWQRAWDAWRQDYLRQIREWTPGVRPGQMGPPPPYPLPPNPAHYPNGEEDGRYKKDLREWNRRFPKPRR
jgi:hypothetical protein